MENALAKILKLQPVMWKWKDGNDKTHYGFIAQDVEKILPELVSDQEGEDGKVYKHVATGDILPYLVATIRELQDQIDDLRGELNKRKS